MELLKHQISGIEYMLERSNAFICDDMGMGKTRTVIEGTIRRNLFPIIIICPASLKINWKNEIYKWTGITTEIDDLSQRIVITNYERMKKYRYLVPQIPFQQIIIDESHNMKNPKAIRTKIATEWVRNIPFRTLMTGSPILNRPVELIAQLKLLSMINQFGGEQKFKDLYCGAKKTKYGVSYQGSSNTKRLHNKLNRLWLRRMKSDLGVLPEKHIIEVPVVEVQQPSPRSFEQIERLDRIAMSSKFDYCVDFVNVLLERGEKVVVFVHHKSVGSALHEQFPKASVITGGQSPKARQTNIDQFQNGNVDLIICSLQASAVGLTLTSARIAVFLEYPWSPSLLAQAQDRIHRLSQTRDCYIYYLYAQGSIDEYRLNKNKFKQELIDRIV